MTLIALLRAAALSAVVAAGPTTGAAQTTAADPHHPDTTLAQATPPAEPEGMAGQGQGAQPGQPGMMPPGMMGQGMMGGMMQPGMMGGMPMMGMHGHMMKIMFAIADVDGDGALSFEEVTAIHQANLRQSGHRQRRQSDARGSSGIHAGVAARKRIAARAAGTQATFGRRLLWVRVVASHRRHLRTFAGDRRAHLLLRCGRDLRR